MQLSLNGEWQFELGATRTRIPVPAAWEAHIADHDTDGPAIYQREFVLPDGWLSSQQPIWLEAQAVSFAASVWVNGIWVGQHTGLWSPFAFEVTPTLRPGLNHIRLEIWKPGQRYPVRECVAGFLPDVYKPFGGIWQPIGLRLGPRPTPSATPPKYTWRSATMWPQRDQVLCNDAPVHLRGVLDWGWHAQKLAPTRSTDEMRDMIAKARALHFNLIKACLYVPDETFFEVCDAEGMWVWLELPLWQPNATSAFRDLARREIEAILQRVQHHACIAILSLGCELDTQIDAALLDELRQLAQRYLPHVLHCDNSGSSEAYGGVTAASGDFYDYHFYTDPHFFDALVDHFDRRYQPNKPWIYGEFCDADTLRTQPNPQSLNPYLTANLQSLIPNPQSSPLLRSKSYAQATAIRKFILEQTRKRHASGGYVLTGWQDTPITISGVTDDNGSLKFDGAEWAQFNADRVLTIDRLRARRWRHGGDRPAYLDPFVFWANEPITFAVAISNGAARLDSGQWRWWLRNLADGQVLAHGASPSPSIEAGTVMQIGLIDIALSQLPHVSSSAGVQNWQLEVVLQADEVLIANTWALWQVPRISLPDHIAGQLSAELIEAVAMGQHRLCWLREPDPRFCTVLPFWREAVHYFEPNTFLDSLQHHGYADLRFYGIASDFALHPARLQATLAQWWPSDDALSLTNMDIRPLWHRFDARQGHWHAYWIEVRIGRGRLHISTLRFGGGLGYQPASLADNPLGAWLVGAATRE
ncbi:MAG: hypothetical protein KIH69_004080 [Anaerolineae bacterium]|nr:hypothetical protein [Anaerolineae bacterium]